MGYMPTGLVPRTNKTEFMRYLNAYAVLVTPLRKRAREYFTITNSMTTRRDTFGMWIRTKHRPEFDLAYAKFWLKRPDLYGKVYDTPSL